MHNILVFLKFETTSQKRSKQSTLQPVRKRQRGMDFPREGKYNVHGIQVHLYCFVKHLLFQHLSLHAVEERRWEGRGCTWRGGQHIATASLV